MVPNAFILQPGHVLAYCEISRPHFLHGSKAINFYFPIIIRQPITPLIIDSRQPIIANTLATLPVFPLDFEYAFAESIQATIDSGKPIIGNIHKTMESNPKTKDGVPFTWDELESSNVLNDLFGNGQPHDLHAFSPSEQDALHSPH